LHLNKLLKTTIMSLFKKINQQAKQEINTGFGINNAAYGGRFVNKNGLPNIERKGLSYLKRISGFHTLLQLSGIQFAGVILLYFVTVNLVFAGIYCWIGVDHLGGMEAVTPMDKFGEAYFFSAQTFTTVGYGRINPIGLLASAVASFEALVGLLTFAIATGLFYGRFSKPRAFLLYSKNALIAPYRDGLALMLRIAPFKNNNLTDAEAKLTAGIRLEENGEMMNRFFQLRLELEKISAMTLSWTLVHPIDKESPFYQFSADDFRKVSGEVLVFMKAFDDMFSNTVVSRSSYTLNELVIGARFNPMYYRNESNNKTVLDLDRINDYTLVDISERFEKEKEDTR
jgi:inward rectifier potassium channel